MATTATLLLLCALASSAKASWTYTQYLSTTTITPGFTPVAKTVTVWPTGTVSATSTNITTITTSNPILNQEVNLTATITSLWLAPDASACAYTGPNFVDSATCAVSFTSVNSATSTGIYIPYTVTNPPSCSKTSFSYVTSTYGPTGYIQQEDVLYVGYIYRTFWNQITVTGSAGEALFVTTYVSTISTDLGGQPVTTTNEDIWMKTDAFPGLTAVGSEEYYLTQCVDPRRFLCNNGKGASATAGSCGTDWIGTYGNTAAVTTAPGGSTSSQSLSTPTGGTTGGGPKPGGVAGREGLLLQGFSLMALAGLTCVLSNIW
jgi:hypothetical protein